MDIMEGPDGRPKGCAMVYFDNPEAARKAIGEASSLLPSPTAVSSPPCSFLLYTFSLTFSPVLYPSLPLSPVCYPPFLYYADMFNDYDVDGRKIEVRYDRMA